MSNSTLNLSGGIRVGNFSTANAPAPQKGLMYYNTDTNTIQQCLDGASYVTIAVSSSNISQVGAYASYGSAVIPGTSTPVTITANNQGVAGNSVALVFSGSNSIAAEIAAWNGGHVSNQVTLTSGDGTQIPSAQTVDLSGGVDSGSMLVGDLNVYTNFTPTAATVAGALEGIDTALGDISGGSQTVDLFTLSGTDISNGYVVLSATPTQANETTLSVENAPGMFYGVDFTVSANHLSWTGLGLDGILSSGDNLTVSFSS